MSRSDAERSAYKRPTEYWCNDDEQVRIIERALDMYEAALLGRATLTDRSMDALRAMAREQRAGGVEAGAVDAHEGHD